MLKIKSYGIRHGVRNHTSTYTGTETAADVNPSNAFAVTLRASFISYAKSFDYTGGEQTWTAPYAGYYKLEVWGAQGRSNTPLGSRGGYGGYSVGVYNSSKNALLYIYVGGEGNHYTASSDLEYGGWNGGGGLRRNGIEISDETENGTGGGSTDIALVSSTVDLNTSTLRYERSIASYNSRIIVAGGGGGGGHLYYKWFTEGGDGGGYIGNGAGGTQTAAGNMIATGILASATFGLGGSVRANYNNSGCCGTGGGGGYYGGAGARANSANTVNNGGGSGYIGSSDLYHFRFRLKFQFHFS